MPKAKRPPAPKAPAEVVIIKRDPTVEGDFMWGVHSRTAMEHACITDNTGSLYNIAYPLFEKWDEHMVSFIRKHPFSERPEVRTEGLRWILENAGPLYEATRAEYCKTIAQEDQQIPTPNDDRDWFCWLYRQFAGWKRDKEANS